MKLPELIYRVKPSKRTRAVYKCECGSEFEAEVPNVLIGRTKSCGCYRRRMALVRMAEYPTAFTRWKWRGHHLPQKPEPPV
jgi:hypothetical protein